MKNAHRSPLEPHTGGFDEHERDTAKRNYPTAAGPLGGAPLGGGVSGASATRRFPKAELEQVLRNESGTQRAVSRDEIDRFARERLAERAAGDARGDDAFDPHSRPTVDAVPPFLVTREEARPSHVAPHVATLVSPEAFPSRLREVRGSPDPTPSSGAAFAPVSLTPFPSPVDSRVAPRPAPRRLWVVPLTIATVIVLAAAWTSIGFVLGRLTAH